MCLYHLTRGRQPTVLLGLDHGDALAKLKLSSTEIADILEAVSEIVTETGNSDVLDPPQMDLDGETICFSAQWLFK